MHAADQGDTTTESRRQGHILPVLGGIILGLGFLFAAFGGQQTKFEQAGLGLRTTAVSVPHDRGPYHCNGVADAGLCISGAKTRALGRKILWFGASQLYGVNEYRANDKTAPWLVFDSFVSRDTDVLNFSFPNGYFQEFLLLFEYVAARLPVDGIVIAAVYDDMREAGIRPSIALAQSDRATRAGLAGTAFGRRLSEPEGNVAATATPGTPTPADPTPADPTGKNDSRPYQSSEAWLTGRLEACCGVETLRAEARGQSFLALTDARRYVAGLRNRYTRDWRQYKVPIPPARYAANRAALEAILESARRKGIPVLLYIAPRPTDFFPYDATEYAAFVRDLGGLAEQYGAALANLEDIVPNEYWGTVDLAFGFPVRDPFHFKARGHQLTAKALIPLIEEHLLQTRPR